MHFIDTKWKLRNLVMGVRHLEEESHTSDLIRDNVENMLDDIALPGTTQVTFTTDGAASMVKAMKDSLMIQAHLVCICHAISNTLKDALAIPEVAAIINKAKDLAGATHKSIKRITAIRRACNDQNSKS
jgi:hypothetical protein